MFKKKTYRDIAQLVRQEGDDAAFAADLNAHIRDRQLVRHLFALRCVRGLSQKDIAEKMGCTQGRISKLEASKDEDLRFGDIRDYAKALGLATILGLEGGKPAVARVKFHHACIKKEVDALAKLAWKDERIAEEVSRFFNEAAFNFLMVLLDGTKQLPSEVQSLGVTVEIVGPDSDACELGGDSVAESKPRRPRRNRKTKVAIG